MPSRRTLGSVALGSLAAAAVSFAVVDQSTAISRSCASADAACAHDAVPVVAVVFAVIGGVALLAGIVPAIRWLVLTIRAGHLAEDAEEHEDAEESAERHRRALDHDD